MREFLMYFLFGDRKRSILMLCAILFDYFMFNLLKYGII